MDRFYSDAIKLSPTARCIGPWGGTLSVGDSDFRLYELLKNGRRFLRIAGESATGTNSVHRHVFGSDLVMPMSMSMVEDDGIEPTTPCLQSRCSPS